MRVAGDGEGASEGRVVVGVVVVAVVVVTGGRELSHGRRLSRRRMGIQVRGKRRERERERESRARAADTGQQWRHKAGPVDRGGPVGLVVNRCGRVGMAVSGPGSGPFQTGPVLSMNEKSWGGREPDRGSQSR